MIETKTYLLNKLMMVQSFYNTIIVLSIIIKINFHIDMQIQNIHH